MQVSGPSKVKLTVGGAKEGGGRKSSTVTVNGEIIRAAAGHDGYIDDYGGYNGGDGFSGGGSYGSNGGSNGGDGGSSSSGSGGEGTGEDVTSYSLKNYKLSPGEGGKRGGGGGVLVNGDGPGQGKYGQTGQGYGGGSYDNGNPGVIILQIANYV